jgi:dockerin type I repeat protein
MRNLGTNMIRGMTSALVIAAAATIVSAATKGPDAGGYSATDSVVYSFVDISGASGGTSILAGTDDGLAALTIPFPFKFYGKSYTIACASSNGALYLVDLATACAGFIDFANTDISSTSPPNDFAALLPMWSDLTFQVPGGGSVFYQTVGAAGSRKFIVQWQNAFPQGSLAPVTFQAILHEGSNRILFQYQNVNLCAVNVATSGGRATIGIRNAGALTNQQQIEWSFNAPVIDNTAALQFSPAAVRIPGDVNGDGVLSCADVAIVKAAFGKRTGQVGFDSRADVNNDGIVNVLDLAIVTRAFPAGTRCP